MTDLKPCPFCGGEAVYQPDHATEEYDSVCCSNCDAMITGFDLDYQCWCKEAWKEAWNTRADIHETAVKAAHKLREYIEALEKDVKRLRATNQELALDFLASEGQAADAYEAQLKAEERAILATRTTPRVKPLEWRLTTLGFEAESIAGKYEVYASINSDWWLWRDESNAFLDRYKGKEPCGDTAKAAAQADYESRILSALAGGDT